MLKSYSLLFTSITAIELWSSVKNHVAKAFKGIGESGVGSSGYATSKTFNGLISIAFLFLGILITSHSWSASPEPVRAKHGIVVSSQRLASQVGVDILKSGGNAVDAAVATGFALAVVHPTAGNIGGGGFMVIRFANGSTTTIDYREEAPLKAHRDMYLDESGEFVSERSQLGYLAVGVPGSVAGMAMALEKYGTKSLAEVLVPAIELAENGFPVSYDFAVDLQGLTHLFRKFPASAKVFLKDDGQPYEEGELFVQTDLARTLRLIAKDGPVAFYEGAIAELIVRDMEAHGGLVLLQDLAKYEAVEREPVHGTYKGYEIFSMGPPSSGGVAIVEMLNILEPFDLGKLGHNSSKTIHLLVEAMRRAFADRAEFLGDSNFYPVPVTGLISKEYAVELRAEIDLAKASNSLDVDHGSPPGYESSQTTHYSVVDSSGMAVSVTTTLNSPYGSKVVVEGAGFLLNNEMDDFSAKPGVPNMYGLVGSEANAIEPEKRMLSSMSPTIVAKDGRVFMVIGSPGGPRIINTVLQVILNVIEHDMNIQEAVNAPRIHQQWLPDEVLYERHGFAFDVLENLAGMGHSMKEVGYFSEAQAIVYDAEQNIYFGAADSRGEGEPVGY